MEMGKYQEWWLEDLGKGGRGVLLEVWYAEGVCFDNLEKYKQENLYLGMQENGGQAWGRRGGG